MFLFSGWQERRTRAKAMTPEEASWQELLDKVRKGLTVRTDSRQIRPGDVFVAISGAARDGAAFVPEALQRGASHIIWTGASSLPSGGEAVFIHRTNPRSALAELAREHFNTAHHTLKVIGLTGTNGKTTVSYLVEHLLASAGLKVGVLGTISYRWPGFNLDAPLTTPDSWKLHELLANMEKSDVDVAVMEVSSHALDQERVAEVDFEAAVWTNLTQDHLDYHPDMESYYTTKSRLFHEHLSIGKTGIINFDDPYGRRLLAGYSPVLGFGLEDPGLITYPALKGTLTSSTAKGLEMTMRLDDRSWKLASPLVGRHNASNLLAAQAVGLTLGLRPRDLRCLSEAPQVPGRLQRVPNSQGLDILVDYAHTPDALVNVLTTLKELPFRRLIVVFGCGGNRDRAKRPLMAQAVAAHADLAVLTSDNPRDEDPAAIMEDALPGLKGAKSSLAIVDRAEAIEHGVKIMEPGDVLLIAGKGHEDYQEVSGEFRHFSDVEEAQKALVERGG